MPAKCFTYKYNEPTQKGGIIMSQTAMANFRLDEEDKRRKEKVCNEIGISMSSA